MCSATKSHFYKVEMPTFTIPLGMTMLYPTIVPICMYKFIVCEVKLYMLINKVMCHHSYNSWSCCWIHIWMCIYNHWFYRNFNSLMWIWTYIETTYTHQKSNAAYHSVVDRICVFVLVSASHIWSTPYTYDWTQVCWISTSEHHASFKLQVEIEAVNTNGTIDIQLYWCLESGTLVLHFVMFTLCFTLCNLLLWRGGYTGVHTFVCSCESLLHIIICSSIHMITNELCGLSHAW